MKRNLCAKTKSTAFIVLQLIFTVLLCSFASDAFAQTYTGKASYYSNAFHGRRCANGEKYDMYKLTCAHKSLPFGTKLKVTNQKNGKTLFNCVRKGSFITQRIFVSQQRLFQKKLKPKFIMIGHIKLFNKRADFILKSALCYFSL